MITVAVSGAAGRMGRVVVSALDSAAEFTLGALYAPGHDGESLGLYRMSSDPSCAEGCDVVVEVTRPAVVMDNVERWRGMGVHVVVGTSGFDSDRIDKLTEIWGSGPPNCLIVPNFSIGAALMIRFSEMAAPFFSAAEVIELHHDLKEDAPSGTAIATAGRIAKAAPNQHRIVDSRESVAGVRGGAVGGVPVHSIRLPGLLAHQEVLFGNTGEVLTIRHDSTDRSSFMAGVLLAAGAVGGLPGVTVGLDSLI